MIDSTPAALEAPPARRSRARWWARAVAWVVGIVLVPFAIMLFLLALALRQGNAPGHTEFTGSAVVSDCARSTVSFKLVYLCDASPQESRTPAEQDQIRSDQLIAPRPVTGVVPVVERCDGADRSGLGGCFFYDPAQIRSVWWSWIAVVPLPLAVFGFLGVQGARLVRRDRRAAAAAPPAPAEPSAAERFSAMYGVDVTGHAATGGQPQPQNLPGPSAQGTPDGRPPVPQDPYDGGPYR